MFTVTDDSLRAAGAVDVSRLSSVIGEGLHYSARLIEVRSYSPAKRAVEVLVERTPVSWLDKLLCRLDPYRTEMSTTFVWLHDLDVNDPEWSMKRLAEAANRAVTNRFGPGALAAAGRVAD